MVNLQLFPAGPTLELHDGERLIDALDDREHVFMPTACRGAHCGTCRVRVLAGEAQLAAAGEEERRTLVQIGARPDERLGCQLVVRGSGAVTLLIEERKT